jgi:hypothetical protein
MVEMLVLVLLIRGGAARRFAFLRRKLSSPKGKRATVSISQYSEHQTTMRILYFVD